MILNHLLNKVYEIQLITLIKIILTEIQWNVYTYITLKCIQKWLDRPIYFN